MSSANEDVAKKAIRISATDASDVCVMILIISVGQPVNYYVNLILHIGRSDHVATKLQLSLLITKQKLTWIGLFMKLIRLSSICPLLAMRLLIHVLIHPSNKCKVKYITLQCSLFNNTDRSSITQFKN